MRHLKQRFGVFGASALAPVPALAHADAITGGFIGGFAHPWLGPDHVAAMVAVGLWGAFLGAPAIYVLPVVFPLVMAMGGALAIVGVPLPPTETAIAASAVALGLMVALAAAPPLPLTVVVVGAFAIFHGYAHGAELPAESNAVSYSAGFVAATGLLHIAGITLGLATSWPMGKIVVRSAGLAIACFGLVFLWRLA
jgi:urease accessory protein